MEGVTGLVQHRADVVVDAHRVHEDERHPPEVETRRIATRGFGFPVFEVEQTQLNEGKDGLSCSLTCHWGESESGNKLPHSKGLFGSSTP